MLDITYRVPIPHRSGQLARVAGAIAEGEGPIGDVVTISVGREHSVREITIEVRDAEQAKRIAALVHALDGVRVHPNEASRARAIEKGIEISAMDEVMREADLVVATTGKPGLIEPSMIHEGPVILALSNPDPQIALEEAERAGTAFAGDGRSINNVLGYPGIFRGALQAGASGITVEMKLAAARAIAALTESDDLVPDALDQRVHDAVAKAVRAAAEESGMARPDTATAGL